MLLDQIFLSFVRVEWVIIISVTSFYFDSCFIRIDSQFINWSSQKHIRSYTLHLHISMHSTTYVCSTLVSQLQWPFRFASLVSILLQQLRFTSTLFFLRTAYLAITLEMEFTQLSIFQQILTCEFIRFHTSHTVASCTLITLIALLTYISVNTLFVLTYVRFTFQIMIAFDIFANLLQTLVRFNEPVHMSMSRMVGLQMTISHHYIGD